MKKYNKETKKFEDIQPDAKGHIVHWCKNITSIAEDMVNEFEAQNNKIELMREEIENLKAGVWEKEYVNKLREENERLREEIREQEMYGFNVTKEENDRIAEFMRLYAKDEKYAGAIGGSFVYQFRPTSIGVIGEVIGPDGQKFYFRDLSDA